MKGKTTTRVLFGVILITLACNLNAAEKEQQKNLRHNVDNQNTDNSQFEPIKRELLGLTYLFDKQHPTAPRLQTTTQRMEEMTSKSSEHGNQSARHNICRLISLLPARLFAVDRLPGHW